MTTSETFPVHRLTEFVAAILIAEGVAEEQARTCALRLLEADARGQRAHGIGRLPAYARRIEEGGLNARAQPRLERESTVTGLVDGDNGLGPVVMTYATNVAIAKAREHGLAWIGVRRSNHAGAGGAYAQLVVDQGLIAIFAAVANINQLAPWGGTEALLGPNPIAIGIPSGKEPGFVLDMATTTVSLGTVRQAVAAGRALPVGWLMDDAGRPVTNPKLVEGAMLVPIGGYKGYGLSLAVAALAGTLNGAASGSNVVNHLQDWTTPTNTGQMIIALDPDVFRPRQDFHDEMDTRLHEIRASRPMPGASTILVPGDRSSANRQKAAQAGLEVGASLLAELRGLARRLGTVDVLDG
jgi:L-2-hydroxycarboxylate dehydrogenase (NAD+)